MSDLTFMEKRVFERVFGMKSGYVLDFSDRTFREFVAGSTGRDIFDERYNYASGSKANRLRGFWTEADNRTVGKLLGDLLDHAQRVSRGVESADLDACRRAATRLSQDTPVPEIGALTALSDERDFEIVAKAVREAIDKNEPEGGLDRLHTFVVKYVRGLCEGVTVTRDKALHSLFGEYVKRLRDEGLIESEMTLRRPQWRLLSRSPIQ